MTLLCWLFFFFLLFLLPIPILVIYCLFHVNALPCSKSIPFILIDGLSLLLFLLVCAFYLAFIFRQNKLLIPYSYIIWSVRQISARQSHFSYFFNNKTPFQIMNRKVCLVELNLFFSCYEPVVLNLKIWINKPVTRKNR